MWFALEGALNRYDGISFRVYEPDPENENSISAGAVNVLFEDSRNRLWIGTRKGPDRFDPETETFKRYLQDPDDPGSISSDLVFYGICEDREGFLWVAASNGGLNRFDPETETFSCFRHDANDPESIDSDDVTAVRPDPQRDSILWVGTDSGLARMDTESGRFERFRHDPSDPYSLSNNDTHPLLVDRVGALWVGSRGGGVDRYDPDHPKFTLYRRNSGVEHGLSHSSILGMLEDREGFVWIGSAGRGADNSLNYNQIGLPGLKMNRRGLVFFRPFVHRLVPTLRMGMHTRTLRVRVPPKHGRIKNQPQPEKVRCSMNFSLMICLLSKN